VLVISFIVPHSILPGILTFYIRTAKMRGVVGAQRMGERLRCAERSRLSVSHPLSRIAVSCAFWDLVAPAVAVPLMPTTAWFAADANVSGCTSSASPRNIRAIRGGNNLLHWEISLHSILDVSAARPARPARVHQSNMPQPSNRSIDR
jgi:hypothetical protein